jgi:hypothetical protein
MKGLKNMLSPSRKQELIELIKGQPADKWVSLWRGGRQEGLSCKLQWVGEQLGEWGALKAQEYFSELSIENFNDMFALNDNSDSSEEAERRIIEYVQSL